MANTLRVISSFFAVEIGDIFELSCDGTRYISKRNEEFHKAGDANDVNASYNAEYSISVPYAEQLVKEGYLEEVNPTKKNFVNVFDEIENLSKKFKEELDNIDLDLAGEPQCVKVEKTTVLTNLITVLDHLKTLRK